MTFDCWAYILHTLNPWSRFEILNALSLNSDFHWRTNLQEQNWISLAFRQGRVMRWLECSSVGAWSSWVQFPDKHLDFPTTQLSPAEVDLGKWRSESLSSEQYGFLPPYLSFDSVQLWYKTCKEKATVKTFTFTWGDAGHIVDQRVASLKTWKWTRVWKRRKEAKNLIWKRSLRMGWRKRTKLRNRMKS